MDLTTWTQDALTARQDAIFDALDTLERWWNGDQDALTDPRIRALDDEYAAIEAELERRAEARDADPIARRMRELVATGAAEDEADALLLIGSEQEA